MVRGINKANIFDENEDKTRFIERLGQNVIEGKCSVYAWVLMDNHVHLKCASSVKYQRPHCLPTGAPDWITVSPEGGEETGVFDVHSASPLLAVDGTSYNTW